MPWMDWPSMWWTGCQEGFNHTTSGHFPAHSQPSVKVIFPNNEESIIGVSCTYIPDCMSNPLSLTLIFSPSFGPGPQSLFPLEWMTRQCACQDGSPGLVWYRRISSTVMWRQKLGHLTGKGMLSVGWKRVGTGNREQRLQNAIDFTFAFFCPWYYLYLRKDSLQQEVWGEAVTAIRGTFETTHPSRHPQNPIPSLCIWQLSRKDQK